MKRLNIVILNFLLLFIFSACEEDKVVTDVPNQLFSPVSFKTAVDGNVVTFSWVPIKGATYSLELSKDSFLFEQDLKTFLIDPASTYAVEDLWSQSRYSARIKAVSGDKAFKDSKYTQITFVTGTENIFYEVTSDKIGRNSVLLAWDNSKSVSKIIASAEGVDNIEVTLSQSEIAFGEKLIEGLTANITYTFKIYLIDMLRGTVTVKTLS